MKRFNPEKELKKIQYGNRNKIIFGVIALLIIIGISSSYALYQVRYSKRIIYTKLAPFSHVTFSTPSDVTITPDKALLLSGETKSFTVTLPANYELDTVSCTNSTASVTSKTAFKVTFKNSAASVCTVTKKLSGYTVTTQTTGAPGASVSPSSTTVNPGASSGTFTVTVPSGYGITDVTCTNDQTPVRSGNTFSISSVTNNTECTVTLAGIVTITISPYASPSTVTAIAGQDSGIFRISLPGAQCKCHINGSTHAGAWTDRAYTTSLRGISCTSGTAVAVSGGYVIRGATQNATCSVTTNSALSEGNFGCDPVKYGYC